MKRTSLLLLFILVFTSVSFSQKKIDSYQYYENEFDIKLDVHNDNTFSIWIDVCPSDSSYTIAGLKIDDSKLEQFTNDLKTLRDLFIENTAKAKANNVRKQVTWENFEVKTEGYYEYLDKLHLGCTARETKTNFNIYEYEGEVYYEMHIIFGKIESLEGYCENAFLSFGSLKDINTFIDKISLANINKYR